MSLSILTVTHNRKEDVQRCIQGVVQNPPADLGEFLVVDNGSTDGTPDWIADRCPSVQLTRWKDNRGLGPALRHLVDASQGEWLMLLDSDTVVPPGTIDALREFGRGKARLGAVAPRMRDATGAVQLTARSFPSPLSAIFGRQTMVSRLWPGNRFTQGYLRSRDQGQGLPFACDWVAFAAALVRREALLQAGSIDPGFFVYWVDADFFRRLRGAGWEVWCCPSVEIVHVEQNRTGKVRNPIVILDFHRGALRYFYRNHGWKGLNPLLPVAAAGLAARAGLHLLVNEWRRIRS
jgi:N-acetylglucosaminyl-diphospho-decaprenol L-rhamnosyltransferase